MEIDAKKMKAIDDMLARHEIMNVMARFMRGIDRHDAELMASVFHPDAMDDHTMYIGPGKELGKTVNAFHESVKWPAHQHFLSNINIELDGDTAHSEAYVVAVGRRPDKTLTIGGARYCDRWEKRSGAWLIAARVVVWEWQNTPEDNDHCEKIFPLGTHDKSDLSYVRPLNVFRKPTQAVNLAESYLDVHDGT